MVLEELVQKFQQKDEKAFESLYYMYKDSIFGVIHKIVRDEGLAEEIAQETFLKAWQNSHSYSSKKGRFFTWILNIGRNAAIDSIRSKQFKQKSKNQQADFFVNILESQTDLRSQTDAIGIQKFVSKLKKKCKAIINLIYFGGYTHSETAETLEIPIGTVKTRNRNCLMELRKMLKI